MKRISYSLLAIFLVVSTIQISGCCSRSGLSKKTYVIATGSKSGVYYPIGETLKSLLNKEFPNITVNIMETAGSIENLQLLHDGKVDLALVQNDISYYAIQGEAMFTNRKITDLSGIATLFPEVVQIIVRKELKIKSLSDLSGKKIAVGNKDSGTFYNAQQILTLAKIWKEVDHQYINAGEAMEALKEGSIDGFFFTTGLPNPSIAELAKNIEIDIVPVSPKLVQNLVNTYSFYYPSTVEPNTYTGITDTISAVEISALVLSGPSLPENDQYLITKHLFTKPNELGQSHPRLNKLTKNTLRRQMPILPGEGARRAYLEVP